MIDTGKLPEVKLAIIGGSGVYAIDGLKDIKTINITTPFGSPSDTITIGTIDGVSCAFLPRHGKGHRFTPSEVNSCANIIALKMLGVKKIIAISACGSLRDDYKPRHFVLPDQIFDRTKNRPLSFFSNGIVGHIAFANPFCTCLRETLHKSVRELGIEHHNGGTYVCIEGPQFSTKAESLFYQKSGFDLIGMTAIPEAKLAREAEICYAMVALITDYDAWKENDEVTPEVVLSVMKENNSNVERLIKYVLPKIGDNTTCTCTTQCQNALKNAIYTAPEIISEKIKENLAPLISKYIK